MSALPPTARLPAAVMLALILMVVFPYCVPPASANIDVRLTAFSDGRDDVVLVFPAAGTDSSLNLSFQTGMRLVTAFINFTGMPFTGGGTDCPDSPSVDFGADGYVEWQFNGTGYGSLGHQDLFADGSSTFKAVFPSGGGVNDSMRIRLPVDSAVLDASVVVMPSGFSGSLNVSLDVGADNITDWNNKTVNGQVNVSGLASLIGAYTVSALPDGTDAYGVRYVDVPVRIRCASAGTLTFTDISVRYNATLTSGNLANRITALIPSALGSQNVTIPVKVGVQSPGRLRIMDIRILARPPLHAPDLLDAAPPTSPELYIDENGSVNFSVRAVDAYGNPFTLQWFLDLVAVPGENGTSYTYTTNYASSGRHSVSVTAQNDLSESSLTWWVNVQDIDRPPVVSSYHPENPAMVSEGSSIEFSINASDPDGGALGWLWTLDGHKQAAAGQSFVYRPALGDAGYHAVAASVTDPGGNAVNISWTVLVRKTNLPPVIQSFTPSADVTVREGQTTTFSVIASDPNGDPLVVEWVLDGYSVGFGTSFNYSTDFQSSGVHAVLALASDGEFTIQRAWNVTVADVDRPPHAVIESPRDGDEYLDSDRVVLLGRNSTDPDRDPLAFKWFDGESLIATGEWANVSLPRGTHAIRLNIEDGKGGSDNSTVNITVRTFRLSSNVTLSSRNPKEGDSIRIRIILANEGDTVVRSILVDFFVDGVPQGNVTVQRVLPGSNVTEFFFWSAEAGRHDMTVTVGNDTKMTYITVPPEMPAIIYWIVAPLVVSLGLVALLSVYFSVLWNRAIKEGIIDERKRRGRTEMEVRKSQEPERRFGAAIHNIRLAFAPYKEKPLVIKTTIPQESSAQDAIKEALTPTKKRYMAHFTSPRGSAAHITQVGGSAPVTAGVFSERRARPPPQPAGREAESPAAVPAKGEPEPAPKAPAAALAGEPVAGPAGAPEGAEEPSAAADAGAPRKPKKRVKDLEERITALDSKGVDVAGPRRIVSLARSFLKGGNSSKAEQYLDKAESKLKLLEKEAGAIKTPVCPKCGSSVDPDWIMCPECESKLK